MAALLTATTAGIAAAQTPQADFAKIQIPTHAAPVIVHNVYRGSGIFDRAFFLPAGCPGNGETGRVHDVVLGSQTVREYGKAVSKPLKAQIMTCKDGKPFKVHITGMTYPDFVAYQASHPLVDDQGRTYSFAFAAPAVTLDGKTVDANALDQFWMHQRYPQNSPENRAAAAALARRNDPNRLVRSALASALLKSPRLAAARTLGLASAGNSTVEANYIGYAEKYRFEVGENACRPGQTTPCAYRFSLYVSIGVLGRYFPEMKVWDSIPRRDAFVPVGDKWSSASLDKAFQVITPGSGSSSGTNGVYDSHAAYWQKKQDDARRNVNCIFSNSIC